MSAGFENQAGLQWFESVQWCVIDMQCLLHKHYINGVTLNQDYMPLKSCYGLELLSPSRYESDLLNEILTFDFGKGAAKI